MTFFWVFSSNFNWILEEVNWNNQISYLLTLGVRKAHGWDTRQFSFPIDNGSLESCGAVWQCHYRGCIFQYPATVVCVSGECLFISRPQSLPEIYYNRLICLIFLFVPGIRANEDSGCYRGESVSKWGTYHFSGTCCHSPFSAAFFLFWIDLQNPITWTNSALILLILLVYLTTSWMFGEWPVYLFATNLLLSLLSFSSLIHLVFINGLCKVSRGVCLKKLKLNVCLCNFPWKLPARLFIGTYDQVKQGVTSM